MIRKFGTPTLIALCCAVASAGLVGCDDGSQPGAKPSTSTSATDADTRPVEGTKTITVAGKSVRVSCSGDAVDGRPLVVLLAGGGDGLEKMGDFQKALSEDGRVCSFDRLGEGKSDRPDGPQSFEDSGKVLTAVLDQVADDAPVVLAGHSLGGIIAARYAPDHQDRVAGLVLLDATSPTGVADITNDIPESATGPAAELREGTLAVYAGANPEKLVIEDAEVRSAGDIPVEVIQHGQQYLGEGTEYQAALEKSWSEGQRKWTEVSTRSRLSTAEKSGHYIYLEQPDIALKAVERVVSQAGS